MNACGLLYLPAYLIEIMNDLSGNKSNAYYYSIGFDVMKVVAVMIAVPIIKMFKRRTLILSAGTAATFVLSLTCVVSYLNANDILATKWITPLLLILYNFICSMGIIPLSIVFKGELFPLQFRGLASSTIGIINSLLSFVTLKFTSNMLTILSVHGTFGVYLLFIIASLVVMYFILPETKDRTLQDIETDFTDVLAVSRANNKSELKIILVN